MPTANPEIVPLAALAEYAKRPFLVTPTQQGAPQGTIPPEQQAPAPGQSGAAPQAQTGGQVQVQP